MQEVVTLTTTDTLFPGGTTFNGYTVSITEASDPTFSQVQKLPPGTLSATFDLQPGSYTATAQTVDASGAALGSPVSTAFTIAKPAQVTIPVVTGISAPNQ